MSRGLLHLCVYPLKLPASSTEQSEPLCSSGIDCNNTFDGPNGPNGYGTHTSCVSEAQRYEKTVYREPKKKGAKNQQQQQQNKPEPTPQEQAPPAPTPVSESEDSKKRAREEEVSKKEEAPVVAEKKEEAKEESKENGDGEPSKKKKKKSKKNKDESGEASGAGAEPAKHETLSSFLSSALPELLKDSVSIGSLREKVVQQAKAKGFSDEKEVEKALFEGMSVGGKKSKVKYEFA
ncbi:hypothetical protein JCM16303_000452 [Sporobolomyces ruberrimus]